MPNNTYKLLLSGHIQNTNTGDVHPPSRTNHSSNIVMQELVDAGLADEDYTGIFMIRPDGKLLIQEILEVPSPTTKKTKSTGVTE